MASSSNNKSSIMLSPFGENHVNSPSKASSSAKSSAFFESPKSNQSHDENSSVLSSQSPSKRNVNSSTGSHHNKSRSLDSNQSSSSLLYTPVANNHGKDTDADDVKENAPSTMQIYSASSEAEAIVPSRIATNHDGPNNVSVVTIENPFDKYANPMRDEIEVVTVTEQSLEHDEAELATLLFSNKKVQGDHTAETASQLVQNPFDQLLDEESDEEEKQRQDIVNTEEEKKSSSLEATEKGELHQDIVSEEDEKQMASPNEKPAASLASITLSVHDKKPTTIAELTVDTGGMTPRARYLRAIQQTADKCKTMIATPKEIVTGPDPTPRSRVSAQLKRVIEGTDCYEESPDGKVQFVTSSQRNAVQNHRSAFDIALKKEDDDTPEKPKPTHQHRGSGFLSSTAGSSDFHTFQPISEYQQNSDDNSIRAPSSCDELSVKEEMLDGTDSSYLQLDVESVASMHNLELEDEVPSTNYTSGPIESLRSSFAMMWNGKSTAAKTDGKKARTNHEDVEIATNSDNDGGSNNELLNDNNKNNARISTMESVRNSLALIWNNKSQPKFTNTVSTPTKGLELTRNRTDKSSKETIFVAGSSARPIKGGNQTVNNATGSDRHDVSHNRGRILSDESLHMRERLPMGSQYMTTTSTTSSRGRSPAARERSFTPVPTNVEIYPEAADDIMECDGSHRSHSASCDSLDDFWAKVKSPYRYKQQNEREYRSFASPKTMASSNTTETEDSFIKAAINAKNTYNVVVTYNSSPETRSWQPPEQEKEQETLVQAILERPDLVETDGTDKKQPQDWDCARIRKYTVICMAVLFVLSALTVFLFCGISGKCLASKDSDPLAKADAGYPPLVLDLPDYTKESLRSLYTAQAKAHVWLERDPNRPYYSESRQIQRFALATLYFSTMIGQNWTDSTSWLDYDTHECFWFSKYDGSDVCENDNYKHLVLFKNNLRGNIPPELALLTSLVETDLSWNLLSGTIPTQLGELTGLDTLLLDKNELKTAIPSEIGQLTNLVNMSLATNDIKGSIPSELGQLTKIKALHLFYNFITGTIPTEVGLLTNLDILDVDVNQLTGTIPSQLGLLSNLTVIWLDWNSFLGPIPTDFGLLTKLEKLYLGRAFVKTSLRGDNWIESADYRIPSELGSLTNLKELYLDNNDLTGLIPSELAHLTKLEQATLDHNLLTDSVYPGICSLFKEDLKSLSIDCNEVSCTCGCTCVAA